MEERAFRGRGRGSQLVSRVSRSPSLSSPSTSSSSSSGGVSKVAEQFAGLATEADSSGPRTRGRSPAASTATRGTPGRGLWRPIVSEDRTVTRSATLATKKGTFGNPCDLLANYFALKKATAWSIYQYDVVMSPDTDYSKAKMAYLRQHAAVLGGYLFDGSRLLYSSTVYEEDPMVLQSTDKKEPDKIINITVRLVGRLEPGDNVYIMFYNTLVKKCLRMMKLEPMGRGYYDLNAAIQVPQYRLCLYPGFITSIRNHEHDVLLCVENTHKVVRTDTVLCTLDTLRDNPPRGMDWKAAAKEEIVGSIVMCRYNNKTHGVSDIDWSKSPKDTFDMKGTKVTYAQYYKDKYGLEIKRMDQPLLYHEPKPRELHRTEESGGRVQGPIYLIPELCVMTGLSDAMRANFQMMKELAQHLHQGPKGRVETIVKFMKTLQGVPEIQKHLGDWGVEFAREVVRLGGRTLPPENIVFAAPNGEKPFGAGEKADWTMAFRNRKMLKSERLQTWSIVVPQRDQNNVDNLVNTMIRVATPLGFEIARPKAVKAVDRPNIPAYMKVIDDLVKQGNELLFVILPNNKADLYGAVKKKLSGEVGLISQCFLAKNVTNKGLMSIATKVVIQMNAKLGGEPWSLQIPIKKMMVVGFDVYHGTKTSKGQNVAAMVASITPTHASYFSTVSFYKSTDELARCVSSDLMKCLDAYKEMNGDFPERILIYRDGVGDGQLGQVIRSELSEIHRTLKTAYASAQLDPAKLTFVVVTKKINTRLFAAKRDPDNPLPGTVCDDVVTLPERYDFFLIPQTARQGAVSPSGYNVLHDEMNLDPDKIQRLTFKFCHLYFNWSGTVAVPAPCQYAHKLAALTGVAIGVGPKAKLNFNLHYL